MITATATTAITANRMMSRSWGWARTWLSALGARLTIPAKMMKLMPLPIPFSVISSPSHIRTTAPAVRVTIWTHDSGLDRLKPPTMIPWALNAERMPKACRSAIGTVR